MIILHEQDNEGAPIILFIFLGNFCGSSKWVILQGETKPSMQSHWPIKILSQSRLGFMALNSPASRLNISAILEQVSPFSASVTALQLATAAFGAEN